MRDIDLFFIFRCVSVSLTCPLLVLPCRDTLLQLLGLDWSTGSSGSSGSSGKRGEEEDEEEEAKRMEENRKSIRVGKSKLNPGMSQYSGHTTTTTAAAALRNDDVNKTNVGSLVFFNRICSQLCMKCSTLWSNKLTCLLMFSFVGLALGKVGESCGSDCWFVDTNVGVSQFD